jgi:protein gp37
MGKTSIAWTDRTWNPIRGCSRVSPGCVNCYAEDIAHRFSKPGLAYEGLTDHRGRWNGTIRISEEHMLDPLKWRGAQRIFVNSMSDLFHENLPEDLLTIDRIFAVMALCPQHTFQILTKRPERMLAYLADSKPLASHRVPDHFGEFMRQRKLGAATWPGWPLPNVWLGVSVENQATADERIPLLLQTPATVRWISAEPLLGPISFRWAKWDSWTDRHPHFNEVPIAEDSGKRAIIDQLDGLRMLDWVVIGGESGTAARPFDIAWAASLIEQCKEAGVACFMKQLGSVPMMAEPAWREQSNSGRTRLLKASNARRMPEGFVPLYSIGKMESFESLPHELRIRQYPEARQ